MNRLINILLISLVSSVILAAVSGQALAASAAQLDREAVRVLHLLYSKSTAAAKLGKTAKGVLVFPKIYKAGFIIGAQYGEGVLIVQDQVVGYYKTMGGSYGLQAGAQAFGYALFFMSDKALKYLLNSEGWEVGVGPSIVVVDQGAATSLTTTTERDNIYAFFFDQNGLMAGLGLQGNKIIQFKPGK
jgi:lipid-binding SYLF domain-containing protein